MEAIAELFTNFGVTWSKLAGQVLTFTVLLIGLRFILYKPMLSMLEERKLRIAKGLSDAEAAAAALAKAETTSLEKLKEATKKAELLIEETTQAATRLKQQLVEETQLELQRLREQQAAQLAQAKSEMLREVKSDVASLVVMTTEKVLQRELDERQQEQLAEQAAKELQ